jgi:hypothetical protein
VRWVQRYDVVNDFFQLFPHVIDVLDNISNAHDHQEQMPPYRLNQLI